MFAGLYQGALGVLLGGCILLIIIVFALMIWHLGKHLFKHIEKSDKRMDLVEQRVATIEGRLLEDTNEQNT